MEVLGWIVQEVAGHWIGVVSGLVGFAVLAAVKRWREAWAVPLLCGITGGGIIFLCVWLPIWLSGQSSRHLEALERVGNEQKAAIEALAKEQKGALERLDREQYVTLTGLLDKQEEALDVLIKGMPTRPYFTPTTASIYKVSDGQIFLTVSVQNNEVPAEKVVSHLLVINEKLDPRTAPLHSNRVESANPIGPGGPHSHHWGPVKVPKSARPAYVVFQIRYTHALSGEEYRQALFLKFHGASKTGTFVTTLFNASSDEKNKIEKYINRRGIAKL